MDNYNLYKDIKLRTGGEIYIGVVGPVRTGKSTFIKRFMDLEVLPGIEDVHSRERAKDELPQSAAGRTIMTTEPKFIPKEAAKIKITDDISILTRLIDCVGYMVDGAAGHTENNSERMVKTPWFDYEIPFTQAAELGTQKVIRDHSTVGIVVTADGSFGDISRESFVPAEERTIAELKKIGKPFVVILNSERPHAPETMKLSAELEEKYKVSVLPVNCAQLKKEDITKLLSTLLEEFPVVKIDMSIPKWAEMLPAKHPVKAEFIRFMKNLLGKLSRMKDIENADDWLECAIGKESLQEYDADNIPYTQELKLDKVGMADGSVAFRAELEDKHYYDFLSDMTGVKIDGEYSLVQMIRNMAVMRSEYEKVEEALDNVRRTGYGVVAPAKEEVELSEPEIIKQGNKFGVKINAKAPSIHLIQADIQMEISPIVGSEEQAKDLVGFIKHNSEDPEVGIWNTNIFGKSIEQIVEDGIQSKMNIMTETSRSKLQETIYKVINDGNGGLVCIII
ncbi:MAG: stage IV sporulation protein A [Lachnospiraceae bacterium]|nr:stage IV sporulation protein A [Lachnospiraceae bacterium]